MSSGSISGFWCSTMWRSCSITFWWKAIISPSVWSWRPLIPTNSQKRTFLSEMGWLAMNTTVLWDPAVISRRQLKGISTHVFWVTNSSASPNMASSTSWRLAE